MKPKPGRKWKHPKPAWWLREGPQEAPDGPQELENEVQEGPDRSKEGSQEPEAQILL